MEDDYIPICPAIYKHFKGNYYATMGVSKSIPNEEFWELAKSREIKSCAATHTEQNKLYLSIILYNNKFYHSDLVDTNDLVLYKPLYVSNINIYARPINMFLSEVDKEKYSNVEQKYRFNLIRY